MVLLFHVETDENKDTETATVTSSTAPGGGVSKRRLVLMPCDASSAAQGWGFGKGLHSPSSMCVILKLIILCFHSLAKDDTEKFVRCTCRYAASAPGLALAIGNDTLFSASYNKDAHSVPSTSYGDTSLIFTPRADQDACTSRDCQNYDDTQMWYFDPTERLLRASTYVASINHKASGPLFMPGSSACGGALAES